jgi:hypothetical protein
MNKRQNSSPGFLPARICPFRKGAPDRGGKMKETFLEAMLIGTLFFATMTLLSQMGF